MCGRRPKPPKEKPSVKINQSNAPAHQPGPGSWGTGPTPYPPFTHEDVPPVSSGPIYEKKMNSESEGKPLPKQQTTYISSPEPYYEKQPPQLNSDINDTKAKKSTKASEPDSKPPPSPETTYVPCPEPRTGNQLQQSNSDSDEKKARKSKNHSGFDQKPAGPEVRTPNTSLPTTTERPKLSSDSEDHVTRKMSELKPPLPSPEKQKMISRDSLENTPHKYPTTYKIEENTTECHTSAPPEKDKNSTRAIRSSQTKEREDIESTSNDTILSATSQADPSDSEGNQNLRRITGKD